MKRVRIGAVGACAIAAAGALLWLRPPAPAKTPEEALQRGVAWLFRQQDGDGAWRSETYGNLKGGAATTALAVYAIAHAPMDVWGTNGPERLQDGEFFARRGPDPGAPPLDRDYLLPAVAMIWTACERARLATNDNTLLGILALQRREPPGGAKGQEHVGGWDFRGEEQTQALETNLAATVLALEAIAAGRQHGEPEAAARPLALAWLGRIQDSTGDGGFVFSPVPDDPGNKAGWYGEPPGRRARSYGSATCDGIRALAACGLAPDHPRVQRAVHWLLDHPDVERVPGFGDEPGAAAWSEALRFYYWQSLSKVLPLLPAGEARRRGDAIASTLMRLQDPDGSWKNPSTRMREDDPLLATSFAVIALSEILRPSKIP